MTSARYLTHGEATLLSRATEHWLRLGDVEWNLGEHALRLLSHSTLRSGRCTRTDIASLAWTVDVLLPGTRAPLPLTLVRPEEANVSSGRLSVLSAIGLALIGLVVGAVAQIPLATGKSVNANLLAARPPTNVPNQSLPEETHALC